jgi:hypothetical protein
MGFILSSYCFAHVGIADGVVTFIVVVRIMTHIITLLLSFSLFSMNTSIPRQLQEDLKAEKQRQILAT